jgi:hypothetical protein
MSNFWNRAHELSASYPLRCEQCSTVNGEAIGKGMKRPKKAHVRVVLRGAEPLASNLALLCEKCWPPKSRETNALAEVDAALQMSLF